MTALAAETRPVTARRAAPDDIPWMLDELEQFADFFMTPPDAPPLRHCLWPTRAAAAPMLARLIETQPVLIAERSDYAAPGAVPERVGFIAGVLAPHPLNPDIRVLSELFWWVVPEARGTRAGALLFQAFEGIGQRSADWIIMTLEAHSPVKPETLTARGYRLHERSFLKEVSPWPL